MPLMFPPLGSSAKGVSTLSTPITVLEFSPVVAMSHSTGRAKDWDDMVTSHADEDYARSWSLLNKKHGKHSFKFDVDEGRGDPLIGSVEVCDLPRILATAFSVTHGFFRLYAFLGMETFVWQARQRG